MTPSIKRMIKLLSPDEESLVDKESVIWLEEQMLTALQFEFNHPSPLTFFERFMRLTIGALPQFTSVRLDAISESLKDETILSNLNEMGFDLLLIATSKICFLNYRPSVIGAAALIFTVSYFDQRYSISMPQGSKQSKAKQGKGSGLASQGFLDFGLNLWSEQLSCLTEISPETLMDATIALVEEAFACESFKHKHLSTDPSITQ